LSECANFDPIFATVDPLNINAYAVQGRYPDSNLMPTAAEAKIYYQLVLQVQTLVTDRIVFPDFSSQCFIGSLPLSGQIYLNKIE
jgi:hypothetical protein